jgi:hypothetical protein
MSDPNLEVVFTDPEQYRTQGLDGSPSEAPLDELAPPPPEPPPTGPVVGAEIYEDGTIDIRPTVER